MDVHKATQNTFIEKIQRLPSMADGSFFHHKLLPLEQGQ